MLLLLLQVNSVTGQTSYTYSDELNGNEYTWTFSTLFTEGETITDPDADQFLGIIEGSELSLEFTDSIGGAEFLELANSPLQFVSVELDGDELDLNEDVNILRIFILTIEVEIEENGSEYNLFEKWLSDGNSGRGIYGDEDISNGIEDDEYFEIIDEIDQYVERRYEVETGLVILFHDISRNNGEVTDEIKIELNRSFLENLDFGWFYLSIIPLSTLVIFHRKFVNRQI